jgi:hypothetical protein
MGRWCGLVDAVSDADGLLAFEDYADRRLPTGERLKTKLATSYIMSEEAARILHLLAPDDPAAAEAVARTAARLGETCFAVQHCTIGECAASFIGYVRFQRAVLGDAATPDITWRLKTLSEQRDGGGRWKRFPPYYTLLVLSELPLAAADDELDYAKPLWAPGARVTASEEPFAARRSRLISAVRTRRA